MTDGASVELIRDEILQGSSNITVNVRGEIDPAEVARAIHVPGVEGEVVRVETGRFVWAARSEIPPGWRRFVVEELTDSSRQTISPRIEIPFFVVATRAAFPGALRIESFTRMRCTERGFERLGTASIPDGDFVDVLKAVNRADGKPISLGFDPSGNEIEGETQLRAHNKKLISARGKLDDSLKRQLSLRTPGESVLVDAWFQIEEPEDYLLARPQSDDDLAGAKAALEKIARELTKRIRLRARGIVSEISGGPAPSPLTFRNLKDRAPVLTLKVPAAFVSKLSEHPAIQAIFLHEERAILDLADSIFIARSDLVHQAGQTGTGVRVAVWEETPYAAANLKIVASYDPSLVGDDLHPTVVHEIICNHGLGSPSGHAPGCQLVSANSFDRAALTWAVDDGDCSVINQSFHRPEEALSSTLSSDDHYKDWLASHPPYPLIVQAAGNNDDEDAIMPPTDEYVNHKGYNTLSVANHSDDATAIDPSSVFRNPSTPHGDRELPEISANGTSVQSEAFPWVGTSFSAPAVSGVAALIQGTVPLLAYWPEGCRALLLATAGPRVSSTRWWEDVVAGVDARDGAGALNAHECFEVAKCRSVRGAAATPRGWDIGLLRAHDFDAQTQETVFSYRLCLPSGSLGPAQIRVAIAWPSTTGASPDYWSNLAVDLDLAVYDSGNVRVGFSGSWDNSYEIVDFVGLPGETYTIKIRSWAPAQLTCYGIAWTAGGSLASLQRPPSVAPIANNGPQGLISRLQRRSRRAIRAVRAHTSETLRAAGQVLRRRKRTA